MIRYFYYFTQIPEGAWALLVASNRFPKTQDVSARSLLQLGVSPRLQGVCSHSNAYVYSGCARYILERFDNSSVSSKSWFFEYPCKFIKILIKSLIVCRFLLKNIDFVCVFAQKHRFGICFWRVNVTVCDTVAHIV